MKLSSVAVISAGLPSTALAWGGMLASIFFFGIGKHIETQLKHDRNIGFGHITVAYIASNFVSSDTTAYFQGLLHNGTDDYLAGIASWADSVRYTKWGRFSANFHFIDAKDDPPRACGIDMARDCKADGCVVSAIHNYTTRLLDASLPASERAIAAKFIVHFVGDTHQPLHNEDVARGGNGIHVKFDGVDLNLHHVWDSSIAEKLVSLKRRQPYAEARRWADSLTAEINAGKFNASRIDWLQDVDLEDPTATALAWASEGNAYVCTTGTGAELCYGAPANMLQSFRKVQRPSRVKNWGRTTTRRLRLSLSSRSQRLAIGSLRGWI